MNTRLIDHYITMSRVRPKGKMKEVSYLHIIQTLEEYFDGLWTYEIDNETFTPDGSLIITSLVLYTPGRIYTGRSVCKTKDCGFNHLFALVDAAKSFMGTDTNVKDSAEPNGQNSTYNMTPEEIVQALNDSGADTQAKIDNYKDEHNMPAEYVELPPNESQPVLEPPHASDIPMDDYDVPQERLKGFSQHQVDRMNEFKRVMDFTDNDVWGRYVAMWSNNKLSRKQDITPENIESFLEWGQELMKKVK